jgi:uncharacterized protein (DUF58 family)
MGVTMNTTQRVVFLLFGLSLVAGIVTNNVIYYRLTYLWLFLILISWLTSYYSLKGAQFQRSARTLRSQVGQIFEEQYEIRNTGRLPRLWIEVRDESNLPGTRGSHVLTMIGGRQSRSYLARTRLTERGVFPLGPTIIGSGDLFGLFPVSRTIKNQDSLLVYPMIVNVKDFPNPPGLLPGGEALRRRTPQITPNASGVREYYPGDPLNRIHWISTARRNRMMVKEFELDPLADVWIFLDAARSVQVAQPFPQVEIEAHDIWRRKFKYSLPPSTLEYAVSATGSLARYYLQKGRAVGLVSSAGPSLRIIPGDRGGRHLGKILEALALVKGDGTLPLHGLVEAQARHLPRGSTAVLITPSPFDTVYKVADLLLRRGLKPVVVLVHAFTFGGSQDNTPVEYSLRSLGIPVCQVDCGVDLAFSLDAIVSYPNRSPVS